MAEFCRSCFIRMNHPTEQELRHIVLSNDNDFCEGCGKIAPVVLGYDFGKEEREEVPVELYMPSDLPSPNRDAIYSRKSNLFHVQCEICHNDIVYADYMSTLMQKICPECRNRLMKLLYPERDQ